MTHTRPTFESERRSVQTTFKVTPALSKEIHRFALIYELSISELLIRSVREYMGSRTGDLRARDAVKQARA